MLSNSFCAVLNKSMLLLTKVQFALPCLPLSLLPSSSLLSYYLMFEKVIVHFMAIRVSDVEGNSAID